LNNGSLDFIFITIATNRIKLLSQKNFKNRLIKAIKKKRLKKDNIFSTKDALTFLLRLRHN